MSSTNNNRDDTNKNNKNRYNFRAKRSRDPQEPQLPHVSDEPTLTITPKETNPLVKVADTPAPLIDIKAVITDLVVKELEGQTEELFDDVNNFIKEQFNANLKSTSDRFAKMTVNVIQEKVLTACHDMIHEHMDKFDVSIPIDKFRALIAAR